MSMGAINPYGRLQVIPKAIARNRVRNQPPSHGRVSFPIVLVTPTNKGDTNLLEFDDPGVAADVIGEGFVPSNITGEEMIDPATAINVMFYPSDSEDVSGASKVYVKRIGTATRPRWEIEDSLSNNVLDIYGLEKGLDMNLDSMKFKAPTHVLEGSDIYYKDQIGNIVFYSDLGRAIRIGYTGSSSCTIEITTETYYLADGTQQERARYLKVTKAVALAFTLDLTKYPTVNALALAINAQADMTAHVPSYVNPSMPPTYLDPVTAGKDIKHLSVSSITSVTANQINKVGAFTGLSLEGRFLNPNTTDGSSQRCRIISNTDNSVTTDGLIDLTTVTASGKSIAVLEYGANAILGSIQYELNLKESSRLVCYKHASALSLFYGRPNFTDYMVPTTLGDYYGSLGAGNPIDLTDWQNALDSLKRIYKKEAIFVPLTYSTAVHALFKTYAQERHERDAHNTHVFCGSALGITQEDIHTNGKNLNSVYSTYVVNGPKLRDDTGEIVQYPGLYQACICAGQAAGSGLVEPVTENSIRCYGLEQDYDEDEIAAMINCGVTVAYTEQKNILDVAAYKFSTALTTWTGDDKLEWRLLSGKMANFYIGDFLVKRCSPAFIGKKIRTRIGQTVQNIAFIALNELSDETSDYQLLMADPDDPVNKPAFYPPTLKVEKGAGYLRWSGNMCPEGLWLFIEGEVQFQDPVFR